MSRSRQQAEFYKALGHAISNWQFVETSLYVLVHCCLRTSPERASAVFFHIQSASNKLGLADKLCRIELVDKRYKDTWIPLRKKIANSVDMRNALAHFEATWMPGPVEGKTKFSIALTPHTLDLASERNGQVSALFVEQIQELAEQFAIHAKELIAFTRNHLEGWRQHASTLPPNLRLTLGIDDRTN